MQQKMAINLEMSFYFKLSDFFVFQIFEPTYLWVEIVIYLVKIYREFDQISAISDI